MRRNSSPQERRRIAFVINSLEGGGAERVLSILLERLENSLQQAEVFLILLDSREERYSVPSYIHKINLHCQGGFLQSIIRLKRSLHRLRPDVVMSFLNRANCANILAARSIGYNCIISERVNTSSHFGQGAKAWVNKQIVRRLYPRADQVLAVSKGVGIDLQRNFGVAEQQLRVIYNPYDLDKLAHLAAEPPALEIEEDYIVSVGRLVPNKNFGMLIRAYQRAGLTEKLIILGEGPERANLEALIQELGLQDRVVLAGFLENPYALMSRARFAVFASQAEGFPNAMAEAMALSLPVIATDCDSGPAEILHDVVHVDSNEAFKADFGLLVPVNNEQAMAQALQWMSDDLLRNHYRTRSRERIGNFSIEETVAQYFSALTRPA